MSELQNCKHVDMMQTPFIMVGTKSDLNGNALVVDRLKAKGGSLVSVEDAQALCKELGGEMVLECSAMTHEGLEDVIDHAIRVALRARGYAAISRRNKTCKRCKRPSRQTCECERMIMEVWARRAALDRDGHLPVSPTHPPAHSAVFVCNSTTRFDSGAEFSLCLSVAYAEHRAQTRC